MKVKLKSGNSFIMREISVDERDELLDSVEYEHNPDGTLRQLKMMHSTMTKWMRICIDSDDIEGFLKTLSLEQRTEIFTEIQSKFFEGEGKASK